MIECNSECGFRLFLCVISLFFIINCSCSDNDPLSSGPPPVLITSPDEGEVVFGNVLINVSIRSDLNVYSVVFYVDGVWHFTDHQFPFVFNWDTEIYADTGYHIVQAVVYENGINKARGWDKVTVFVSNIFIGTVNDLSVVDTSYSMVTLRWTAPGINIDTGKVSAYEIRYSKYAINDYNWLDADIIPNSIQPAVAGSPESLRVNDLEPITTYYFAMKSILANKLWSDISNNATALTGAMFATQVEYPNPNGNFFGANSASVKDFDGDGDLDIATINCTADNGMLFLNDGNGAFSLASSFQTGDCPYKMCSADFNGDEKSDLAVANIYSNKLTINFNSGSGMSPVAAEYSLYDYLEDILTEDIDIDGDYDLVLVFSGINQVMILFNDGDGNFGNEAFYDAAPGSAALCAADLNSDNIPDIAATTSAGVIIYIGKGDGTFYPSVGYGSSAVNYSGSIAAGDIDGDGDLDLVRTMGLIENIQIFLNSGNAVFDNSRIVSIGDLSRSVCIADFDDDGNNDIAATGENDDHAIVLINAGDGTFNLPVYYPSSGIPIKVIPADLDNDGDIDLVVVDAGSGSFNIHFNKTY